MLEFHNAKILDIAVHQVGNKSEEEDILFSEGLVTLSDIELEEAFHKYFFSSFSGNEMYEFYNTVGVEQNEMYELSSRIFDDPDALFTQSRLIAQHLYDCSAHPKIKGGELYVAYFNDIILDDEVMDAIGIFKSETKDRFLKVDIRKKFQLVNQEAGTNINKLDKGCLVLKTRKETGYKVCIIDNLNKSTEAAYWKTDFLGLMPLKNEYHQTNQFLGIAKQFVTKQLSEEFEVTKALQIDYLNRSVDYFKNHETFDKEEFEQTVFTDSNVIEAFRTFDEGYRQDHDITVADSFGISAQAVKKQARIFKSVLKLDKNFHIYIHGDRELIEQGVDENGRKYYKIYYNEES